MKKPKEYAQDAVKSIAHGAQPYHARIDALEGVTLTAHEVAEFRMWCDNGSSDRMRDLRAVAEVLYKHVIKLDDGKCIAKSKALIEGLIDIRS